MSQRIAELDGLRAIGAISILCYHLWPTTLFIGWTRVDFFFILSGYFITLNLIRHELSYSFLFHFWMRRIFRTWPPYYLLLFLIFAFPISSDYFSNDNPLNLRSFVVLCTFTQDLTFCWPESTFTFPSGAVQTWSLAIEQQFYLFWPVLIVLVRRPRVIPLAVCLIITSIIARKLGVHAGVIFARFDGLALGALLASITNTSSGSNNPESWLRPALIVFGLLSFTFFVSPWAYMESPIAEISGCGAVSLFAVNGVFLSIVGLIISYAGHPLLSFLRNRILCYLGEISYGIYIYHLVVFDFITKHFGQRTILTDSAKILFALIAAAISWECFERPIGTLTSRISATSAGANQETRSPT